MVKKSREREEKKSDHKGQREYVRALSTKKRSSVFLMGKHFSIYFKFDRILISKCIPWTNEKKWRPSDMVK